jgi:hypothetical protein
MTGQTFTVSNQQNNGLSFEKSTKLQQLANEFSRKSSVSSSSASISTDKKIVKETLEVRSQLIDWIIIVSHKLKQGNNTFFLAVEILDQVIEKFNFNLSAKDLHLIGVVSLLLASKYEEVMPISMKLLLSKICHNKYTKEEIITAELLILTKLGFRIPKVNYIDIIYQLVDAFDSNKQNETYLKQVYSYALSLTKAVTFDFGLKQKINSSKLLTAIVYFSMLEVNNYNKNGTNKVSAKFGLVTEALGVSNREVIKYCNLVKERKASIEKNKGTFPYIVEYEFKDFMKF